MITIVLVIMLRIILHSFCSSYKKYPIVWEAISGAKWSCQQQCNKHMWLYCFRYWYAGFINKMTNEWIIEYHLCCVLCLLIKSIRWLGLVGWFMPGSSRLELPPSLPSVAGDLDPVRVFFDRTFVWVESCSHRRVTDVATKKWAVPTSTN